MVSTNGNNKAPLCGAAHPHVENVRCHMPAAKHSTHRGYGGIDLSAAGKRDSKMLLAFYSWANIGQDPDGSEFQIPEWQPGALSSLAA